MVRPPDEIVTTDKGLKDATSVQRSSLSTTKQRPALAIVPAHIFAENMRPPVAEHKLPQPDERPSRTPPPVCCLGLLEAFHSPDHILETNAHKWLQVIEKDADELERLHDLSKDVIRALRRDELKDAEAIAK
jgi:hypothetical protein